MLTFHFLRAALKGGQRDNEEDGSMAGQKMLKFINVERDMPEKRVPNLRNKDFDEIYAQYATDKAAEQASRCSQCGVPYCQSHCPLQNNIPDLARVPADWLLLICCAVRACRSRCMTVMIAGADC